MFIYSCLCGFWIFTRIIIRSGNTFRKTWTNFPWRCLKDLIWLVEVNGGSFNVSVVTVNRPRGKERSVLRVERLFFASCSLLCFDSLWSPSPKLQVAPVEVLFLAHALSPALCVSAVWAELSCLSCNRLKGFSFFFFPHPHHQPMWWNWCLQSGKTEKGSPSRIRTASRRIPFALLSQRQKACVRTGEDGGNSRPVQTHLLLRLKVTEFTLLCYETVHVWADIVVEMRSLSLPCALAITSDLRRYFQNCLTTPSPNKWSF